MHCSEAHVELQDLAVATGRFDLNNSSSECSGVVLRIGNTVHDVHIGDSVYGITPGNFGNYVRAPAISVQKMASGSNHAKMASMPIVYMTAVYAFIHLAHLSKGETVLIQSAAGGLGMAALRIARYVGAEIYATVGNPEKVKILVDKFGVARDHILSSRELSAIPKIMEATGKRGIDVILCSAAGEQMHETWRCIAPMGRFIEVGRTNVMEHGKLSLEVFKRNATFSSFDLGLLYQQNPQFCARYVPRRRRPVLCESSTIRGHANDHPSAGRLMAQVNDMFQKGIIQPIDHIKTFDISELEQAMTFFANGTHMGKVVVTFNNPQALLKVCGLRLCNAFGYATQP